MKFTEREVADRIRQVLGGSMTQEELSKRINEIVTLTNASIREMCEHKNVDKFSLVFDDEQLITLGVLVLAGVTKIEEMSK
jgi:alkylhydroperoxidase family enzyme